MRRLLTNSIKAILTVAILSTAAHWALRFQREADIPAPTLASIPDPDSTGSISPRKVERATLPVVAEPVTLGLDQDHLMKLISNASAEKPKPQKAVAKR